MSGSFNRQCKGKSGWEKGEIKGENCKLKKTSETFQKKLNSKIELYFLGIPTWV